MDEDIEVIAVIAGKVTLTVLANVLESKSRVQNNVCALDQDRIELFIFLPKLNLKDNN